MSKEIHAVMNPNADPYVSYALWELVDEEDDEGVWVRLGTVSGAHSLDIIKLIPPDKASVKDWVSGETLNVEPLMYMSPGYSYGLEFDYQYAPMLVENFVKWVVFNVHTHVVSDVCEDKEEASKVCFVKIGSPDVVLPD